MQIQIRLRRSRDGITVNVQSAPSVELLFKDMCPEQSLQDAQLLGRYWSPAQSGTTLQVYAINPEISSGNQTIPGTSVFWNLVGVGHPLVSEDERRGLRNGSGDDGPRSINLSLLRLKGISEPGGVTFRYHGILDEEDIEDLAKDLHQASTQFYNLYLRDLDITLRVNKED